MRIYRPEFTFISENHFVITENLKVKDFNIDNPQIQNWIWTNFPKINSSNNIIKIDEDTFEEIEINRDLTIQIKIYKDYLSQQNRFLMKSFGNVKFISNKELTIFKAIELYNNFQKFLFFFNGKSNQFTSFKFNCLGCRNKIEVYYRDKLSRDNYSNFLKLDYQELKEDLSNILKKWFLNEDIIFCVDVILENLISVKVSHSRRFINSFFSFEAMIERFLDLKIKNPSTKKYLNFYKNYFIEIAEIEESKINQFLNKIIRSRDYYVHSKKTQNKVFTNFELLYISFLLDYIVAIELLKEMKVSEKNITKVKRQAKSIYVGSQSVNKLLNENSFMN